MSLADPSFLNDPYGDHDYVEPSSAKRKRSSAKKKKRSHKKIKIHALLEQKFQPLFPCTHCDEQFETVQELFAHNKNHPNPTICPQCKKEEPDPSLFAAHVWEHMGVRPFRCPQPDCGFRSTLKSKLDTHQKTTNHTGQFGLRCPHCPRCLASTVQLYSHIRTHSAGYTCPYCQVVHKNPANFTQHVRKHTNEKPYRCVCGYRAVSKGLLKSHALKCQQVDSSDYKQTKPPRKSKKRKGVYDDYPGGRKRGRFEEGPRIPVLGQYQPPPLPPHNNTPPRGNWINRFDPSQLWVQPQLLAGNVNGVNIPLPGQPPSPPHPPGGNNVYGDGTGASPLNNRRQGLMKDEEDDPDNPLLSPGSTLPMQGPTPNISASQEVSLRHALSAGLLNNPDKLEKVSIYIGLPVKVIEVWRRNAIAHQNSNATSMNPPLPPPDPTFIPGAPPELIGSPRPLVSARGGRGGSPGEAMGGMGHDLATSHNVISQGQWKIQNGRVHSPDGIGMMPPQQDFSGLAGLIKT